MLPQSTRSTTCRPRRSTTFDLFDKPRCINTARTVPSVLIISRNQLIMLHPNIIQESTHCVPDPKVPPIHPSWGHCVHKDGGFGGGEGARHRLTPRSLRFPDVVDAVWVESVPALSVGGFDGEVRLDSPGPIHPSTGPPLLLRSETDQNSCYVQYFWLDVEMYVRMSATARVDRQGR